MDKLKRRGKIKDIEVYNAATLHAEDTVELLHDVNAPPYGRCKVLHVNTRHHIITLEALPIETKPGDLVVKR